MPSVVPLFIITMNSVELSPKLLNLTSADTEYPGRLRAGVGRASDCVAVTVAVTNGVFVGDTKGVKVRVTVGVPKTGGGVGPAGLFGAQLIYIKERSREADIVKRIVLLFMS